MLHLADHPVHLYLHNTKQTASASGGGYRIYINIVRVCCVSVNLSCVFHQLTGRGCSNRLRPYSLIWMLSIQLGQPRTRSAYRDKTAIVVVLRQSRESVVGVSVVVLVLSLNCRPRYYIIVIFNIQFNGFIVCNVELD